MIDNPVEIIDGPLILSLGQEWTHVEVIQRIVYVLINLLLGVIYYFEAFQVNNHDWRSFRDRHFPLVMSWFFALLTVYALSNWDLLY